jgi:hypothetical protein
MVLARLVRAFYCQHSFLLPTVKLACQADQQRYALACGPDPAYVMGIWTAFLETQMSELSGRLFTCLFALWKGNANASILTFENRIIDP